MKFTNNPLYLILGCVSTERQAGPERIPQAVEWPLQAPRVEKVPRSHPHHPARAEAPTENHLRVLSVPHKGTQCIQCAPCIKLT